MGSKCVERKCILSLYMIRQLAPGVKMLTLINVKQVYKNLLIMFNYKSDTFTHR